MEITSLKAVALISALGFAACSAVSGDASSGAETSAVFQFSTSTSGGSTAATANATSGDAVTSTSVTSVTSSGAGGASVTSSSASSGTGGACVAKGVAPPGTWLSEMNYYRQVVGAPAVTEDAMASAGDAAHAKYTVETGVEAHSEDMSSPYYTPAGDLAAQASNVDGNGFVESDHAAIMDWMQAPFHWVGMIDPSLQRAGYGSYADPSSTSGLVWAAALDVVTNVGTPPSSTTFPILWPADCSTTPLKNHYGEIPEPVDMCGYTLPSGAPIVVQYGAWVQTSVTAHTLTKGGVDVERCVFDQNTFTFSDPTWQEDAREILQAMGAVVIIPRAPLEPGATYEASITANGITSSWSFSVAPDAI